MFQLQTLIDRTTKDPAKSVKEVPTKTTNKVETWNRTIPENAVTNQDEFIEGKFFEHSINSYNIHHCPFLHYRWATEFCEISQLNHKHCSSKFTHRFWMVKRSAIWSRSSSSSTRLITMPWTIISYSLVIT